MTDWTQAVCAQTNPEAFFPPKGGRNTSTQAKALCFTCPIRLACLREALTLIEEDDLGIRGGLTPGQRHLLRVAQRAA